MTLDAALQTGWSGARSYSMQQQPAPSRSNPMNRPAGRNNVAYRNPSGGTNLAGSLANPTLRQGTFAQAMSQISCNPSSAAQGSVLSSGNLSDKLFEQIQLALALKMGLNGPQQVKERALHNVLTNKSARGDMKQILQSRAEIYRDVLDPN